MEIDLMDHLYYRKEKKKRNKEIDAKIGIKNFDLIIIVKSLDIKMEKFSHYSK